MEAVTLIQMSEKDFDSLLLKSAKVGAKEAIEELKKNDVRSVKDWSKFLGVDTRTIISKIEKRIITPAFKNPYRISKYEIEQAFKS